MKEGNACSNHLAVDAVEFSYKRGGLAPREGMRLEYHAGHVVRYVAEC